MNAAHEPSGHVAETARLRLRCLRPCDDAFILELLSDPAFIRNIGDRGVRDLESARRYIEVTLAGYAKHGFGLYAMELKQAPGAIGMCGLLRRDTHPDVEIGFAMLPQFRRQGFTLEACREILQLAIGKLALTRVVAIAAPFNQPSIHILERLGMRYERQVLFAPGGSESSLFTLES